jgi:probable rRNA maturation factor
MASRPQSGGGAGVGRSLTEESPGVRHQRTLALSNRQRLRQVDLRLLRRIALAALGEVWSNGTCDLAIHVVAAPEIISLNETFLKHTGSTDVITFDYGERVGQAPGPDRRDAGPRLLHGEIFVCMDEALSQSRRFHTTWQSEVVRYVVHGMLHLLGYDDHASKARRKMKRAEDALVRELARQFHFPLLGQYRVPARRLQARGCPASQHRSPPRHY